MSATGGRSTWSQMIGSETSFDEVISKKTKITEEQADELCKYSKK